jgi:hypothetical protein
MDNITYSVRFWKTKIYKGPKVTTYTVRWVVGGREWKEPFRNLAQAESFRARLMTTAREGDAFDVRTGRRISWKREKSALSWYAVTRVYVDVTSSPRPPPPPARPSSGRNNRRN